MGSFGAVSRRIFSIVGSALNFGLRRMETIMRVAWLPVTLILILEMATVFTYLSIAVGRVITFADVATYLEAKQALSVMFGMAWSNDWTLVTQVYFAAGALQLILIAAFMAPLIRFAGLGERPAPGVIRLAFGMDQIRFLVAYLAAFLILPVLVLAPIGATAFYVFKYLSEIMTQLYASFPDPDSLHTVEIIAAPERLAEQGKLWLYRLGVPVAAAAPFALIAWAILVAHFRPRQGAAPQSAGLVRRAAGTLIGGAGAVSLLWFYFLDKTPELLRMGNEHLLAILALVVVIIAYANIRALPYAGIAVCRRSLSFAGNGRVTRGWRLVWIMIATAAVFGATFAALALMNFAFGLFGTTLNTLYFATESATRLANGGDAASWVYPTFVWVWNIVKIVVNIFWVFFTYGVFAGFLGRLYRESDGTES